MSLHPDPGFDIRTYQPGDREAVFRIAAQTAFLGQSAEAYLDDRRLFCESFYAYYTDLEPEHGWVAVTDGDVSGFLMGSSDTKLQKKRWTRQIMPKVIRQSLRGHYRIGKKTLGYVWGLLQSTLRGELPPVDLALYPAHLHINVDPEWQGQGIGRRLMDAYLEQLRLENIPGVHLHTTSANTIALSLYRSLGFVEIGSRQSTYFSRRLGVPIFNVCYGRKIGENPG